LTNKKRPAVVVSSAVYHRERPDLILIAVTSQVRPANPVGEVAVARWQEAGLLKPSVIKPVLATVHRSPVVTLIERWRDSLTEIWRSEAGRVPGGS